MLGNERLLWWPGSRLYCSTSMVARLAHAFEIHANSLEQVQRAPKIARERNADRAWNLLVWWRAAMRVSSFGWKAPATIPKVSVL